MDYSSEKLYLYCLSMAQEFQARLNRFRIFVQHSVTSGTANEVILREFLARHVPGNLDVAQGFICDPTINVPPSKQIDILVYSRNNYPLVYSDGSVKVVLPESVFAVIESKTAFNKTDIEKSLENIESAKQLRQTMKGYVFAFTSRSVKTVIKHLEEYGKYIPEDNQPDAIFLLDKAAVIHRWGYSRTRDLATSPNKAETKPFAVRMGKGKNLEEKQGVILAFLLLMFLETVSYSWIPSIPANVLLRLIDEYTDKYTDDVSIGQKYPDI